MTAAAAFTVPVTLTSRTVTGTDADGNDVYGTATSTVQGVFAPGGSVESTAAREQVVTQPTVYLPASVDVTAVDAVTVGGLMFEVDADPQRWDEQPNPWSGWVPPFPVVVPLRKVTG